MLISMDPEIPTSDYREIEELIASDDSPVGIDAKKTHIESSSTSASAMLLIILTVV